MAKSTTHTLTLTCFVSTRAHRSPISSTHTPAHNPTRTHSEPPLTVQEITDRGFFADPGHARLRAWVKARGGTIKDLGICMGAVIEGENIKMEELGDDEKDDL